MLDKTRKRKIRWQETALEDTYIAAVKGIQTYRISLNPDNEEGRESPPQVPHVQLIVKDEFGGEFLDHSATGRDTLLYQLFEEVKHAAAPIQERIGKSVELLNSL